MFISFLPWFFMITSLFLVNMSNEEVVQERPSEISLKVSNLLAHVYSKIPILRPSLGLSKSGL